MGRGGAVTRLIGGHDARAETGDGRWDRRAERVRERDAEAVNSPSPNVLVAAAVSCTSNDGPLQAAVNQAVNRAGPTDPVVNSKLV
jgi:hypothetical protein